MTHQRGPLAERDCLLVKRHPAVLLPAAARPLTDTLHQRGLLAYPHAVTQSATACRVPGWRPGCGRLTASSGGPAPSVRPPRRRAERSTGRRVVITSARAAHVFAMPRGLVSQAGAAATAGGGPGDGPGSGAVGGPARWRAPRAVHDPGRSSLTWWWRWLSAGTAGPVSGCCAHRRSWRAGGLPPGDLPAGHGGGRRRAPGTAGDPQGAGRLPPAGLGAGR